MATTTIDGDEEAWEYIDVLNTCISILLTVGLGAIFGHFKIFEAKTFVPVANKFIFYVALPLLVLQGLGIGIDLYNTNWTFISLFLALRAIGLLLAMAWVYIQRKEGEGIGQVAVIWLSFTWISTIILGVPISSAVFGNKNVGLTYGVLAGISSFIFQLPVQLLFFEYHVTRQGTTVASSPGDNLDGVMTAEKDVESSPVDSPDTSDSFNISSAGKQKTNHPALVEPELVDHTALFKRLGKKLVRNPVLLAIIGGFILSLSTVGPTYLNPTNPDHVPGLEWFWYTIKWLGDCVSPVALFTMGLWMYSQGGRLFQLSPRDAFVFMLSKLVIVPAIMLGLALAADLSNEAGRAAVLIAALPISMASFPLGNNYNIGEAILAENVAMGTILILPTVLIWNLVLDALDLYPIANN